MRLAHPLALFCIVAGMAAAQENAPTIEWPKALYDPAEKEPADLVLPMPCGGAMAFQRVLVPLDVANPFSDRRVRLGQSDEKTAYATYLRQAFLRGAFEDENQGSYFYVARYELTVGQYKALTAECDPSKKSDRLAQGGLSWFDAVDLGATYSSWLIQNAPDLLPRAGDGFGFVRLPTEVEWEFAARGGGRVDASVFGQPTFFDASENPTDYALIYSASSARSKPGAVALRLANPLGLFDVYGNAEELMLEPFRLNALGRQHGQIGGVVTRGGSVLSTSEEANSSARVEYPPFDRRTGAPLSSDTFGVRFVLSAHITNSDAKVRELQADWIKSAQAASSADPTGDPLAELSRLVENETDQRRLSAFNDLAHSLQVARQNETTLQEQTARSAMLAGAVLVEAILETEKRLRSKVSNIRMLVSLRQSGGDVSEGLDMIGRQLNLHTAQLAELRRLQQAYLLSIQSVFEVLNNDISAPARDRAWRLLSDELTQSEQTRIADLLARLKQDYAAYEARQDQNLDDLRTEILR